MQTIATFRGLDGTSILTNIGLAMADVAGPHMWRVVT